MKPQLREIAVLADSVAREFLILSGSGDIPKDEKVQRFTRAMVAWRAMCCKFPAIENAIPGLTNASYERQEKAARINGTWIGE